jgi:ABC-type Fe3+ transport system permease subunit
VFRRALIAALFAAVAFVVFPGSPASAAVTCGGFQNECHWDYYSDSTYTHLVGSSLITCDGTYTLSGVRSTFSAFAAYAC